MRSRIGNGDPDVELAALLDAVDDDRAFLRSQEQAGNSGIFLAQALRERDLSR